MKQNAMDKLVNEAKKVNEICANGASSDLLDMYAKHAFLVPDSYKDKKNNSPGVRYEKTVQSLRLSVRDIHGNILNSVNHILRKQNASSAYL